MACWVAAGPSNSVRTHQVQPSATASWREQEFSTQRIHGRPAPSDNARDTRAAIRSRLTAPRGARDGRPDGTLPASVRQAAEHGESEWTGRLIPLTMDGLIYASSMMMRDPARRGIQVPALARCLACSAWALSATLAANVAHETRSRSVTNHRYSICHHPYGLLTQYVLHRRSDGGQGNVDVVRTERSRWGRRATSTLRRHR
jgi:hypothetical protein